MATNLAIFASGAGSNAGKICSYFADHTEISVALIVSNRSTAGVLGIADQHGIEKLVLPKTKWEDHTYLLPALEQKAITHIVLAGFLLLVPEWLINLFPGRIINIHPALLPRFGGKGMYGANVHQHVKASGELISGITIHEVDENYDEGLILFQETVELTPVDTPEVIAGKVLELEHYHYPRVIEKWCTPD